LTPNGDAVGFFGSRWRPSLTAGRFPLRSPVRRELYSSLTSLWLGLRV